jgi:hypothetical protein
MNSKRLFAEEVMPRLRSMNDWTQADLAATAI